MWQREQERTSSETPGEKGRLWTEQEDRESVQICLVLQAAQVCWLHRQCHLHRETGGIPHTPNHVLILPMA